MTVGAGTEALAGEGSSLPQAAWTRTSTSSARSRSTAPVFGRDHHDRRRHGPGRRHHAVTSTPGPWNISMMLKAAEEYPMNLGFTGKGNCSDERPLAEQIEAGAIG